MGEMFALKEDGGRTSIGRGLQTDVRINDEGISRTHAVIEEETGLYYLCDAGSTNGTFANGVKVERQALKEGDKIQIGASSVLKFTFHDDLDEDFQRNLYESALRDRLTGAFNRGYFGNRLESDVAFALRHGKPLSLVMFDVDNFKQINDTHGHLAGDQVIAQFGELLAQRFRTEDLRGRWGGEEFILAFPGATAAFAHQAATRLLEDLQKVEFRAESGQTFRASFTAGVALWPDDAGTMNGLVQVADERLYQGKREGRGRVCHPEPRQVA